MVFCENCGGLIQEDLDECSVCSHKNNSVKFSIRDRVNMDLFLKEKELRRAQELLNSARDMSDFQGLLVWFEELSEFYDVSTEMQECKNNISILQEKSRQKKIDGILAILQNKNLDFAMKAKSVFKFSNTELKRDDVSKAIANLNERVKKEADRLKSCSTYRSVNKAKEYYSWLGNESNQVSECCMLLNKLQKNTRMQFWIPVFVISLGCILWFGSFQLFQKRILSTIREYKIALHEIDTKKYSDAISYFSSHPNYSKSEYYVDLCNYELGYDAQQQGAFDEAIGYYKKSNHYENADSLIKDCSYNLAGEYFEDSEWDSAYAYYMMAEDYKDSKQKAVECMYSKAYDYAEEARYEDANTVITQIKGDIDKEKYNEFKYALALKEADEKLYESAINIFNELSGYKDSDAQRESCVNKYYKMLYDDTMTLVKKREFDKALLTIKKIDSDYKDVKKQIKKIESLKETAAKNERIIAKIDNLFTDKKYTQWAKLVVKYQKAWEKDDYYKEQISNVIDSGFQKFNSFLENCADTTSEEKINRANDMLNAALIVSPKNEDWLQKKSFINLPVENRVLKLFVNKLDSESTIGIVKCGDANFVIENRDGDFYVYSYNSESNKYSSDFTIKDAYAVDDEDCMGGRSGALFTNRKKLLYYTGEKEEGELSVEDSYRKGIFWVRYIYKRDITYQFKVLDLKTMDVTTDTGVCKEYNICEEDGEYLYDGAKCEDVTIGEVFDGYSKVDFLSRKELINKYCK